MVLRSSKMSPYSVNTGKTSEIKVLVREEDKETAQKVIEGKSGDNFMT